MKTIEQRWTDFESRVVAVDAAPLQDEQMRIAFYAGFKAMLDVNFELAELDPLPPYSCLRSSTPSRAASVYPFP